MNAKDGRGITALGVAVGFNRIPCVKALLAAGADVHLTDAKGSTVLHYAAGVSHGCSLFPAKLACPYGGSLPSQSCWRCSCCILALVTVSTSSLRILMMEQGSHIDWPCTDQVHILCMLQATAEKRPRSCCWTRAQKRRCKIKMGRRPAMWPRLTGSCIWLPSLRSTPAAREASAGTSSCDCCECGLMGGKVAFARFTIYQHLPCRMCHLCATLSGPQQVLISPVRMYDCVTVFVLGLS